MILTFKWEERTREKNETRPNQRGRQNLRDF